MRLIGIEPMTYRLGGGCSIQLSYGDKSLKLYHKTTKKTVKNSTVFISVTHRFSRRRFSYCS